VQRGEGGGKGFEGGMTEINFIIRSFNNDARGDNKKFPVPCPGYTAPRNLGAAESGVSYRSGAIKCRGVNRGEQRGR